MDDDIKFLEVENRRLKDDLIGARKKCGYPTYPDYVCCNCRHDNSADEE